MCLALHLREFVETNGTTVAIHEKNHCETNADFGRSNSNANVWPSVDPLRNEKANKLMLTEFKMSSIDISTRTAFFRAMTP
jgi:hypothetical protein